MRNQTPADPAKTLIAAARREAKWCYRLDTHSEPDFARGCDRSAPRFMVAGFDGTTTNNAMARAHAVAASLYGLLPTNAGWSINVMPHANGDGVAVLVVEDADASPAELERALSCLTRAAAGSGLRV